MKKEIRIKSFKVTSEAAPTQIEGNLVDGRQFYIKYRNGRYYYENTVQYTDMQTGAICEYVERTFSMNLYLSDPDCMPVSAALVLADLVYLSEEE